MLPMEMLKMSKNIPKTSTERVNRVFVGNISDSVAKTDLQRFFATFDPVNVIARKGFAYADFSSTKNVDLAIENLQGKELLGSKVTLQHAIGFKGGRRRQLQLSNPRRFKKPKGKKSQQGGPKKKDFCLEVKNLASRVTWQDLRDLFSQVGSVIYAEAHRNKKNEGALAAALKKFQAADINGRKIVLSEKKKDDGSTKKSSSTAPALPLDVDDENAFDEPDLDNDSILAPDDIYDDDVLEAMNEAENDFDEPDMEEDIFGDFDDGEPCHPWE